MSVYASAYINRNSIQEIKTMKKIFYLAIALIALMSINICCKRVAAPPPYDTDTITYDTVASDTFNRDTTVFDSDESLYLEVKQFACEMNAFYPKTISPFMTAKSVDFDDEVDELIYEYTLKRADLIEDNYGSLDDFKDVLFSKFAMMAKMDPYQSKFLHNNIVIRYNFTWENGESFESVELTDSIFN